MARQGAACSFRDYAISFYSDRTPELKTGLPVQLDDCQSEAGTHLVLKNG
jgi:hypothetical protein